MDQSLINPPPKTVPQNWLRRCNGGDTVSVLLGTTGNTVAMSASKNFSSAQSLRRYTFRRQGGARLRTAASPPRAQSTADLALDKQGEEHRHAVGGLRRVSGVRRRAAGLRG